MEKTLSIIIPTYNMEKYLNKCLNSLIVAPELMDKLEVLVVNDGSKDRSSEIAHSYADKYPNTFLVIDKENGNYGSCINAALKVFTGKYVKVLDADDSFDTKVLTNYLNYIDTCDDDLILTAFNTVDETGHVTNRRVYNFVHQQTYDFITICNTPNFWNVQMHGVTYKRTVFENINYRQTEGISYTDQEWVFAPMQNVKSISYHNETLYQYLLGREGQTMSDTVMLKSISHKAAVVFARLNVYNDVKSKLPHEIKGYFLYRLVNSLEFLYRNCLVFDKFPQEELIEYDKCLKNTEDVYNASNLLNVKMGKLFPFTYIAEWRKNYNSTCRLRIGKSILKLQRVILNILR